MGWIAGSDVSTGDIITAAQWNNYMGAAGSLEYLKTEADKHDDVTKQDVTASRAIDATVYENTSGKTKLVVVSAIMEVEGGSAGDSEMLAHTDSANPPTEQVDMAEVATQGALGEDIVVRGKLIFIVKAGEYYKVTATGAAGGVTPILIDWIEYDLL